ncbi:recombinase family protein [Gluconobacter wancherniae]|uniref:recombinase family protein n=1 Tax=Gluconobacter wancherniae TaxID=1307955 RepID=UPI001B8B1EFC|nr:recombinase family protein [Gluconobacter wancherniae]MBS1089935.1 recombinase family protein [Gluconobacter wancherniae]
MKYGYARVSTLSQDLNEQITQLMALGVDKNNIYSEKITGTIKSDDRKQFKKLLNKLSYGDELVVMKLDRLGRTAIDIQRTILDMKTNGIILTIDGVGTIKNDMVGNLTVNLLSAFAEFERALIVDRTQTGRKRAIEAGKKMGRRMKLSKEAQQAIKRRYGQETGQALATEYGVGLRTIQRIASGS